MSAFKPFIRITILSLILTSLLIYLGVKYHWVDHFNKSSGFAIELEIPAKKNIDTNNLSLDKPKDPFAPDIIQNNTSNAALDSMNKEQITEQCENLLSRELKDPLTLELATVNCVVSNFQETFQNVKVQKNVIEDQLKKKKSIYQRQCNQQFIQSTQYSIIEKQLLIGICVSDKINTSK